MSVKSIGSPSGPSSSTCGYCSPPGERSKAWSSYHTAGLDAITLSCEIYQKMIDRGWRRSGTWCYKPNLKSSCCPQYTIKLDALAFKASKSQRKSVNRWNRFVLSDIKNEEAMDVELEITKPRAMKPGKTPTFSLSSAIHACETSSHGQEDFSCHDFKVSLEPSSFTKEKYSLFEKYQSMVHVDHSTPVGFKRFLVDSPLLEEPIPYLTTPSAHLPLNYGSYHQLYRLDGQLIAMGVIDILPSCVSSVYFVYDVAYEGFSLGKLSALREISLASEIQGAGAPQMRYLYMGYYIHSCQKMRYKGQYSPSYLADPETYLWFPLSVCIPILDKYRYACFSNPEHSLVGLDNERDVRSNQRPLAAEDLDQICVVAKVVQGQILTVPISATPNWTSGDFQKEALAWIHGLGIDVAREVTFML